MTSLNITDADLAGLKDKVTIITGGGAGIGLATSNVFSQHGAIIYIADLRPPPNDIPNATFIKADVTSWSDLLNLFTTVYEKQGKIDILIANAGVGEIEDIFKDTFDEEGKLKEPKHIILDINLKGVVNCVKLAVHFMKAPKGKGGSIVMTGSTASYLGEPIPSYTMAKHGVLGLMRAQKQTFIKDGITINVVAPWMTESNLMFPALRAALLKANIPINRPESIGKALGYSAVAGKEWNGKTIYCADNKWTEIETVLGRLEPQWLGEWNAKSFRDAEKVDYFAGVEQTRK